MQRRIRLAGENLRKNAKLKIKIKCDKNNRKPENTDK